MGTIIILSRLEAKLNKQKTTYKRQIQAYEKDPAANLHSLDLIEHPKETTSGQETPEAHSPAEDAEDPEVKVRVKGTNETLTIFSSLLKKDKFKGKLEVIK